MKASESDIIQILEQVAGIEGMMWDDIEVHIDSVTTYIPTEKLDRPRN